MLGPGSVGVLAGSDWCVWSLSGVWVVVGIVVVSVGCPVHPLGVVGRGVGYLGMEWRVVVRRLPWGG